jgi:hypothetical protein
LLLSSFPRQSKSSRPDKEESGLPPTASWAKSTPRQFPLLPDEDEKPALEKPVVRPTLESPVLLGYTCFPKYNGLFDPFRDDSLTRNIFAVKLGNDQLSTPQPDESDNAFESNFAKLNLSRPAQNVAGSRPFAPHYMRQ